MQCEVDIVAVPVLNAGSDGFRTFISKTDEATATKQETANAADHETDSITMAPGEYLAGTCFRAFTARELLQDRPGFGNLHDYNGPLPSINLSSQDITRWKMAWSAIQAFRIETADGPPFSTSSVIQSRCKDWPGADDILENLSAALGFSAAAFIYGGLHALAWFAYFHSSTEQLLWQISACVVMGGVSAMHLLAKITQIVNRLARRFGLRYRLSDRVDMIIILGLLPLVLLAYILARAYLVVECFISLSHLPAGVYYVPNWAAYFPHIS